jgi:hypothetical protein
VKNVNGKDILIQKLIDNIIQDKKYYKQLVGNAGNVAMSTLSTAKTNAKTSMTALDFTTR